jgi:hypothetical protein
MDFENFLGKINKDDKYKALVKEILTHNKFAMHDAPLKYLEEKDLLLFAARFDPFVPEFMATELKKDKEFLLELAKHTAQVPNNMDDELHEDKEFLLKLIKRNNKTALHIDVLSLNKAR